MTSILAAPGLVEGQSSLAGRFADVRDATERLCVPLLVEDCVVSSMPDVSPTKWHLAHTSWFFETFVRAPFLPSYRALNPKYAFLFNSYYVQAGERHCRAQRGLVTRPSVAEVYEYRAHVNAGMRTLLAHVGEDSQHPAHDVVELGLHHEQQHQELLVTDIKHVFWTNPMRPVYRADTAQQSAAAPQGWTTIAAGVQEVGYRDDGFHFDNEGPAHLAYVQHSAIAHRLVTNAEFGEFIADYGYRRPELWLSRGWAAVQDAHWKAPLYWENRDESWQEFTLAGTAAVDPNAPVTHVSYYEADAFARWSDARLPTEVEWEVVARDVTHASTGDAAHQRTPAGRFVEAEQFHPRTSDTVGIQQLFGDVWQWTQSSYVAYPGYRASAGALGEYNGKWMSDQWVLRGASCATPHSHARVTYRNFFPSDARWQFTGIRLARDVS